MTPTEVAATLRKFNEWRRTPSDGWREHPTSKEITAAIDAAVEMIEAAEKERDALRSKLEAVEKELEVERMRLAACGVAALGYFNGCAKEYESASLYDVMELRAKNDALRAKVEAMEKQEPARLVTPTAYRWRYRGAVKWQYGELTEETVRLAKEHNHEVQALGILHGAKGE